MVTRRRGFTLVELLTVIGILAVLAAILFPVFARARESGRRTQCISNLKQLGAAFELYSSDYDDLYPWACDAPDVVCPQIWDGYPQWQAWLPFMPRVQEVIQPYVKNHEVFHCASDTGFDLLEGTALPMAARPTEFAAHGSSYHWRTELAFEHTGPSLLPLPVETNVLMDGHGSWHGGNRYESGRWNLLFGDAHVKNVNADQLDTAWATPVR